MLENVLIWITCRDYERYLGTAVLSAFGQTHHCCVHVAHDDCGGGSPVGVGANRNRVMEYVDRLRPKLPFEWVLFLDADDQIPRDYVETLYEIGARENADVVACDAQKFGDETDLIQVMTPITYETLLEYNTVHCSALIRLAFFRQYGGYDETMNSFEDWELWLRFARNGARFEYSQAVRLQYRQHGDSRHHQKKENISQARGLIMSKQK